MFAPHPPGRASRCHLVRSDRAASQPNKVDPTDPNLLHAIEGVIMAALDTSWTIRAARRAYDRRYDSDGTARERRYAQGTPRVHSLPHHHITTPSLHPISTHNSCSFFSIDTPTFVIRDRPSTILGPTLHFFESTLNSQFLLFLLYRHTHFCELGSTPASPTGRVRGRVRNGRPPSPGGPLARMGRTRSVSVVPTANRRGGLR